ncbi:DUF4139 domain-containing protein [Dyella sp.]|uniref:DUF4139 domain-containing protein n=1 Tax=Dyella sp. TaxID=1869338 RepID=UPI002ED22C68
MRRLSFTLLPLACATAFAGQASAAQLNHTELTLYRSDDSSLFDAGNSGAVRSGFALAREPRTLDLQSGTQDISIGGLPQFLDTEGLSLHVDGAKVLSQQLRLDQSENAMLSGMLGKRVTVRGQGQVVEDGVLIGTQGDGLLIRKDDGHVAWAPGYNYVETVNARDYTAAGAILNLKLQSQRSGQADAVLSYPTSGLGWRASYIGTLQGEGSCKLQFESRASIANRSGRDWNDVKLSLIAGEPNLETSSGPRPVMMMAKAARAPMPVADAMPEQSSMADYRQYSLPATVDLPNGSVTQSPLYATRTIDCERTALFENGSTWQTERPAISNSFGGATSNVVSSSVSFKAFDNLPAGYIRVLTGDSHGAPQYVGQSRIGDVPKGQTATIRLGNVFDITPQRERTAFSVDKAGRTMDESFKITLSNASSSARVVTVREHPNRWREWNVSASSIKPSKQNPDVLEFAVNVPANGNATLEYTVRYHWSADVQPQ